MQRRPLSHILLASAVVSVLATTVPMSAQAQPLAASATEAEAPAPVRFDVPDGLVVQPVVREGSSAILAPTVVRPLAVAARVSDGFGLRNAPTAGASTNHQGVDLAPGAGTPVLSVADGVVSEAVTTDAGGCGVSVRIDHIIDDAPVTTVYCHLLEGSVTLRKGDSVAAGQQIGAVGNTGTSTGAHLHFEVRPGGGEAIEPLAWLAAHHAS